MQFLCSVKHCRFICFEMSGSARLQQRHLPASFQIFNGTGPDSVMFRKAWLTWLHDTYLAWFVLCTWGNLAALST